MNYFELAWVTFFKLKCLSKQRIWVFERYVNSGPVTNLYGASYIVRRHTDFLIESQLWINMTKSCMTYLQVLLLIGLLQLDKCWCEGTGSPNAGIM